MEILNLVRRTDSVPGKKLSAKYDYFEKLIAELREREMPPEIVSVINQHIGDINSFSGSNKALLQQIRKALNSILRLIEKELKLVPQNLFRARWLAIGMSVFGIPLGMAFGTGLGNMAFLGIGLPFGMVIGMAVGAQMDKKAFNEGRQLDIDNAGRA